MNVGRSPSVHFTFETVGDGIMFGRARRDGTALANTTIVDLGAATLVFDSSLTLRSAREIAATARARTGRSPTLCVNSHWHLDHLAGNQVFADHPIVASQRTVEILLAKRAELEAELSAEKLAADLRELERQQAALTSERGRAVYAAPLRLHRALLEEAVELRFTPPTQGFEGTLELPGDRTATLLTFGSGHTESDTVLFLPDDGLLLAGDLVVAESHPNLTSGDPVHWLRVLDRIEALRPERIATGHGPLGSLATVAAVRDYLTTILALAEQPGPPTIPSRFGAWDGPEQFELNVAFLRARGRGS
jgi:cyclase